MFPAPPSPLSATIHLFSLLHFTTCAQNEH
jgi:hypothetical protein